MGRVSSSTSLNDTRDCDVVIEVRCATSMYPSVFQCGTANVGYCGKYGLEDWILQEFGWHCEA
jgi:hypothetical protein